jgi:hypothetical protein
MSKTINIGYGIEGQIRVSVDIEFLPMVVLTPTEDRTSAGKRMLVNDTNARLGAVAKAVEVELEKMSLEELENRVKKES